MAHCALPDRTLSPAHAANSNQHLSRWVSDARPTSRKTPRQRARAATSRAACRRAGWLRTSPTRHLRCADAPTKWRRARSRSPHVLVWSPARTTTTQARTSLPCPARSPRRPRQPISPRRCRSRLSSLMSPTTAHSLGSAPRCRPPPGPALRGAPRGRAHCHTHQLPSRPTGHQRGQVLLGRCTFLAGRGPQPAP